MFLKIALITLNILLSQQIETNQVCFEGKGNKTVDIAALILARGGSKGIPRKNLVKINGISLLGRTLILLVNCNLFSEVWVSTEDKEIALEAEKYGALVHERPEKLALDNTPSIDAVQEFMEKHNRIDSIALFQCTSVFLKESYIIKALTLFKSADCVFAATRSFKLRWKKKKNGAYQALNFDSANRPRRQDWSGELIETGMFYFSKRELIAKRIFQNDRCLVVEIAEEDSLEVDTRKQLILAEYLLHSKSVYNNDLV